MRKLFNLLVFLFLVGIFFQCFVIFMSKEHHIKYQVVKNKNIFLIEEKYQIIDGKDRYQFVINGEYVFDVFVSLHKTSRLISDILYYKDDDYTCIYPIFRTKKIKMDVLCKKDHLVFYHTIKGKNKKLDAFVQTISDYDFSFPSKRKKKFDLLTVYPDAILDHHFIALQNYKGIYHISKKDLVVKDSYYTHDIYEPLLSTLKNKYFVSALYKGEDTFDELIIIRLDKNIQKKLKIPSVSVSSAFHFINGQIYLEDSVNQNIYLIYPEKRTYKKVSLLPKSSLFSKFKNKQYDKIEETPYYYYLYKKIDNKVKVSRVFKENTDVIVDLFTVSSLEKVKYYDSFLYFISDGHLYYYSDSTGLRKVVTYEELRFNKTLNYYVYIKH